MSACRQHCAKRPVQRSSRPSTDSLMRASNAQKHGSIISDNDVGDVHSLVPIDDLRQHLDDSPYHLRAEKSPNCVRMCVRVCACGHIKEDTVRLAQA